MSELPDWFAYNKQFDLLICTPCGIVIIPGKGGGVKGHLDYTHHSKAQQFPLSNSDRHKLLQRHEHRTLNPEPRNPELNSPPIPYFPVLGAFSCLDCVHICSTLLSIKYHARKKHRWSSKKNSRFSPHTTVSYLIHRFCEVGGLPCPDPIFGVNPSGLTAVR
jgi:Orsellinic acid/F9775 biosynthesis cluster protein D